MTTDEKLDLLLLKMTTVESKMTTMESTVATKQDIADMATKQDIADMATKQDIADMATKQDIADMATKQDIADMVTKQDIADMATKQDIADMVTKQDIADMVTNKSLDKRLNDIENNILEELHTVQEKSNKHYNDIDDQLKMAYSVINTIKVENGTVNLLLKSVSDLQTEVESLKARFDKVS